MRMKAIPRSGFNAAASIDVRTQESWAQGRWSNVVPVIGDCLVDDRRNCQNARDRIKPNLAAGITRTRVT
jgi:hypothetical protein